MLGGAFNPPHIGHLTLAREAASQLGLERVILVPTGEAPHKTIAQDPGPEVRLELTRLAAQDDELFEVSDFEVRTPGPSYTYRTLEMLGEQRPGEELIFLLGADAAAELADWEQPRRVLELARLGIARRPGVELAEVEAVLERLGGSERFEIIAMPEIGVSSTELRRRIAERRPVRDLIPAPVATAIGERGLYREAVPA